MSNFDFLKDFDTTLWKLGNRIEKNVTVSPAGVKADATTFLEHILKKLLTMAGLKYNSRKPFTDQVDEVFRSELKMSNAYRERIKSAYNYRNKIHDEFEDIEKHEFQDALNLHEKLFYIARKFYRDYNDDYDEYKGVPEFRQLEFDFSADEVKNRDFNEIVDVKFDYCIVCGEPNHLNYSIYCHECSRKLDNANNFISVRNAFGKDARFTKEDLIEYGMPEGYVNQFLNSLVRENMLKVAGRFYTFNNMILDEYLKMIDDYIAVGELITRFKEDKISPDEIKKSEEYKLGSIRQEPFYQFYKITNREIVKKFEKDLLTTNDFRRSVDYTMISDKQIKRWYNLNLSGYRKDEFNESFILFNELLIKEYLTLKSEGILEGEIRKSLNVTDKMYDFWLEYDNRFEDNLKEIKIELLSKAICEGKTREEVIRAAGVTAKEYDDLVKVSDFNNNEFSRLRNEEIESRKSKFIEYLKENDVETSCKLAKISLRDFNEWYEQDMASDFYINTTHVLMHNFLNQRRMGKTKTEAAKAIGLDAKYVEHWFTRTLDICEEFKNSHVKVIADLILQGFKDNKSKSEITKTADVSVDRINTYLDLGKRGYGTCKLLYDYYAEHIIPRQLSRLLDEIKNKPLKKALALAELSEDEFNYHYERGKNGDSQFAEFYHNFNNVKLNNFLKSFNKGKGKAKSLKNAKFSEKELDEFYELGKNGNKHYAEFYERFYNMKLKIYIRQTSKGADKSKALKMACLDDDELDDDIDDVILSRNMNTVMKSLYNNSTTKKAAITVGIKTKTVHEWYMKGKEGDDRFTEFADYYYNCYILPGSVLVQNLIRDDFDLRFIFKKFRDTFTREDYNFWLKHGFLEEANEMLEEADDGQELVDEIFDKSTEYEDNLKKEKHYI